MLVNELRTYLTTKKAFKNNAKVLDKIDAVIEALEKENTTPNMELKKIVCRKSKSRYSIRVTGQYRILFNQYEDCIDLVCICDHDKYDTHNKNC